MRESWHSLRNITFAGWILGVAGWWAVMVGFVVASFRYLSTIIDVPTQMNAFEIVIVSFSPLWVFAILFLLRYLYGKILDVIIDKYNLKLRNRADDSKNISSR